HLPVEGWSCRCHRRLERSPADQSQTQSWKLVFVQTRRINALFWRHGEVMYPSNVSEGACLTLSPLMLIKPLWQK
ncbi:hypothetical protein ILYODFUR_021016, partial [Ilyodon furcidens]